MLSEYGTGGGVLGAGLGRAPAVCALDERAAAAVEAAEGGGGVTCSLDGTVGGRRIIASEAGVSFE